MIQFVAWLIASFFLLKECAAGDYGYKRPVTYAGPIVYSDEKPPIINFPGPPSSSSYTKSTGSAYGGGGYGYSETKGNSITYVPLPLDDLPILIYQSKDKPPIHVINRPGKDVDSGYGIAAPSYSGSSSGGYSGSTYASATPSYAPSSAAGDYNSGSYGSMSSFGNSLSSYGGGSYGNTGSYGSSSSLYGGLTAPKPVYVPKPSAPSAVYLPQAKPQYSTGSYGSAGYGSNIATSGSSYGGSMSYNNGGSSYGNAGGYSQPPHIIYSGHPPIHVYQQPSVYNQPSYGSSSSSGYGSGNIYGSGSTYGGTNYGTSAPASYGGSGYGTGYGGTSYGNVGTGYGGSSYNSGTYGASYGSGSYGAKPLYAGGYAVKPPSYAKPKPSQTYVPAPPGYHKPPIIIYQGVRPPVHVYSEPAPSTSYEQTGGYGDSNYGSAGYGGYSRKNGAEWEPLKPQEGQLTNTIGLNEKIDSDVVVEDIEPLVTSDSSNKDLTTEPVSL